MTADVPQLQETLHALGPEQAQQHEANLRDLLTRMAQFGTERGDPVRTVPAYLGDRWSSLVMHLLNGGMLRHADLRRLICIVSAEHEISQRMLTLKLRILERDGLIERQTTADVPPRVEYRLTPLGQGMYAHFAALVGEVVASLDGAPPVQQTIAANLPTLALDRTRMRLLLRNLLDNALRHSVDAPLPPAINIQPEGSGLRITVRDHGPGVPDDQLPHLAQPFYRPDAARERATGGVGLGLYLCKLVAQAHGGSFMVRNALPGLEVVVTLPLPGA